MLIRDGEKVGGGRRYGVGGGGEVLLNVLRCQLTY